MAIGKIYLFDFKHKIGIECKFQEVTGTAIDKICSSMAILETVSDFKHKVIVIDGVKLLETHYNQIMFYQEKYPSVHVFTIGELIDFMKKL